MTQLNQSAITFFCITKKFFSPNLVLSHQKMLRRRNYELRHTCHEISRGPIQKKNRSRPDYFSIIAHQSSSKNAPHSKSAAPTQKNASSFPPPLVVMPKSKMQLRLFNESEMEHVKHTEPQGQTNVKCTQDYFLLPSPHEFPTIIHMFTL